MAKLNKMMRMEKIEIENIGLQPTLTPPHFYKGAN